MKKRSPRFPYATEELPPNPCGTRQKYQAHSPGIVCANSLIKSSRASSEEGKWDCNSRINAVICSVASSALKTPLVPLDGPCLSHRNQHLVIAQPQQQTVFTRISGGFRANPVTQHPDSDCLRNLTPTRPTTLKHRHAESRDPVGGSRLSLSGLASRRAWRLPEPRGSTCWCPDRARS